MFCLQVLNLEDAAPPLPSQLNSELLKVFAVEAEQCGNHEGARHYYSEVRLLFKFANVYWLFNTLKTGKWCYTCSSCYLCALFTLSVLPPHPPESCTWWSYSWALVRLWSVLLTGLWYGSCWAVPKGGSCSRPYSIASVSAVFIYM